MPQVKIPAGAIEEVATSASRVAASASRVAGAARGVEASLSIDGLAHAAMHNSSKTVLKASGMFSNLSMITMIGGSILGWIAGRPKVQNSAVGGKIQYAADLAKLPNTTFEEFPDEVARVTNNAALTKAATNVKEGVSSFAKKMLGEEGGDKFTKHNNVLYTAGTVVSSAATLANLTYTTTSRIQTLQDMQFALTGKKPSAFGVLFNKKQLHPLVQQARNDLTGWKAGVSALLEVVGSVGNIYLMHFDEKPSLLKNLAISMGTNTVANVISSGDTTIKAYDALMAHEKQGIEPPANLYQELISGLFPNLSTQKTLESAQQAMDQKWTTNQLLTELGVAFEQSSARIPTVEKAVIGKHTADVVNKAAARAMAGSQQQAHA